MFLGGPFLQFGDSRRDPSLPRLWRLGLSKRQCDAAFITVRQRVEVLLRGAIRAQGRDEIRTSYQYKTSTRALLKTVSVQRIVYQHPLKYLPPPQQVATCYD